ncbi:serine hydrolase [Hymenobacter koreensis]|uniref:Serine hydrolase n=1 Tax=Hymenobacter koreensis TaxID=1084523 RepID=A0ABP8J3K5_9BACT
MHILVGQRLCFSLCIISCLFFSPASGQKKSPKNQYFPPPGTWEQRRPEQVGMNAALLQEAVQFAVANETKAPRDLRDAHYESAFGREPFGYPIGPMKERGTPSGLVIRNGYVVAQWGTPERVDLTFSVAKSFLSTMVGLAQQDGLIKSIDDKVAPYMAPIIPFAPWNQSVDKADELGQTDVIDLFATEHNRQISWDHLLRQTSDWEGTLWGKPDWADRPQGKPEEWRTRPRNAPGSVYKYNDTRVNVLALATMNLWRLPLPQVLKERIMDPIGASSSWRWTGYENSWVIMDGVPMQAVSGGSHWGGGLFISAWDQARFGLLTLRNGSWNGRSLLAPDWLRLARTPTPAQPTYGFMNYFLNTDRKLYPSAPATAFAHIGAGTNMVYVDPENDLIIVARWIENNALDGLIGRVLKSLQAK